jgi:hypothetical protein
MNIAVVGGERLPGLMEGVSSNANRLHRGYHYPRDAETARQCQHGYGKFKQEFESAILKGVRNAYSLPAKAR